MAKFFSKKRKDITMQVYKTNKELNRIYEPAAHGLPARASKKESSEGMWEKCPSCASIMFSDDLEANHRVCPTCGYHFRLGARDRIAMTADEGSFEEFNKNLEGGNPLQFPGYQEKLEKGKVASGLPEAIVTGKATIKGSPCILVVMDSNFMMGSMGAAVGEKFTLAAERALHERLPLVAFTASGGARMQEGLVSLMQMGKTSAVLARLDEARIPYFVVLTDPTTGGVTASFAMLGDVTLAEPEALIGFAGRRVVEQTVKQTLPQGFQTAEFLLEKGFVDMIVQRSDLQDKLHSLLELHALQENAS